MGSREPAASSAVRLSTAIVSYPGTYKVNEDAAGETRVDGLLMVAVADGLGGHGEGDVASGAAIDACASGFRVHPSLELPALEALIQSAHTAIREAAHRAEHSPRSTLTVFVSDGASAVWAHVGDSRLYHFRGGAVRTRTRDHSVPEMLHRAGDIRDDEIPYHPDRNRLLQALGQEHVPKPALSSAVALEAGDVFLLCSDGWWEHVREDVMLALLREERTPGAWLERMAALIASAGVTPQDNYTAAAVWVGSSSG